MLANRELPRCVISHVRITRSYFQAAPLRIVGKPFQLPRGSCPFADEHVESLIATVDARVSVELPLLAWDVTYRIIVYRLAQEARETRSGAGHSPRDTAPSLLRGILTKLQGSTFSGSHPEIARSCEHKPRLQR